jgi:hypothetical protein
MFTHMGTRLVVLYTLTPWRALLALAAQTVSSPLRTKRSWMV